MKKQKIVLVFSNVFDTPIYRGIIEELSGSEFALDCIFLGHENQPLLDFTRILGTKARQFVNVTKAGALCTLISVMFRMFRFRPNVVLTFGQTASLIGLTGSLFSSRAIRIYLRMHTSMHQVENYPRGVIYDNLCNFIANIIVVPNSNTRKYLERYENVNAKKIRQIEFGFNLDEFGSTTKLRIDTFRQEFGLESSKFVIGIASRYSVVKGLQYSLPAISRFLSKKRESVLILAGLGDNPPPDLLNLIKGINPKQLRMISRVRDMPAFYKSLSVFIHTPIDETVESFGLVYVESLAAGTPTIFTLSGIAKDICVDGENSLIVDFRNDREIEELLEKLFSDEHLRVKMSFAAKQSVSHLTISKMRHEYRELVLNASQYSKSMVDSLISRYFFL